MYEPDLLRCFVAVAENRSFSEAGRQLGISQPTVSQRVRRLEEQTGRALFARDTHSVGLTDGGEAMLAFARRVLAVLDEAHAYFSGPAERATVRFGTADDLALTHLPGILRDFRRKNPLVDVEITVGQSAALVRRLKAGALDLVYVRQEPGIAEGHVVRREQLIWSAHPSLRLDQSDVVPLVTYPRPSHSRAAAVAALESAGRRWKATCTVRDIAGVLAGVRAGLGVAVFPGGMMPPDLVRADATLGLPRLGTLDFALIDDPAAPRAPIEALSTAIIDSHTNEARQLPGTRPRTD